MQIKSQPLANKILGVADKTSFTGADFTLPTCNKIYPLFSVLHLALEYVAVLPPSVIRLLVSIMPFSVSQGFEGLQINILKLGFRIRTN